MGSGLQGRRDCRWGVDAGWVGIHLAVVSAHDDRLEGTLQAGDDRLVWDVQAVEEPHVVEKLTAHRSSSAALQCEQSKFLQRAVKHRDRL